MLLSPLYCTDSTPQFLGIFNFELAPRLLFYSYIPITVVLLSLALYIFFNATNRALAKALVVSSLASFAWVATAIVQWLAVDARVNYFAWEVIGVFEIIIYIATTYFFIRFVYQQLNPSKSLLVIGLLLLPVILLLPTTQNLTSFDINECQGTYGAFWTTYIYAVEILAAIVILGISLKIRYKSTASPEHKKQVLALAVGIVLFMAIFTLSNVSGELLSFYEINLVGPLGMVILVSALLYSIVRFKTFKVKILATQALVWALWFMIGAILFVAQTGVTRVVTSITEIIAIIFGIMLIKSVRREVEQKEELAKLNVELAEANTQLTELNRQKTELVSFASHDLQSPINKVKQFASLILDGTYKGEEKILETVGKIKFQGEEATKMVVNFLDLRKIEEGQMPFNPELVDITALVSGIVAEEQSVATKKNIALAMAQSKAGLMARIDQTQMRQVIENLVSNAIKYTEPVATKEKPGRIDVSIIEEQNSVKIVLKDTGIGMDKALLPILFEQFRRDPNVAKKIQGTGLGLYITKKFVLLHHGEIWAESEGKGFGSSFFVRLPKA